MVDMIAPAPGGGVTSPFLIQSQQNDPRVMLARAMLANSQNDNTPLYSPFSALAKALQGGLAGAANVELGQEYQQRQQALGDTMAQALKAGQTGLPGWKNPDTGEQAVAPTAPGFEALAQTLMQSPDPAAQQMGMQYGMQGLATKQAAQINFLQKLAEKGLTMEPGTGKIVSLPNYGQAEAANVEPVARATAEGTATGTNTANAQPGIGGQAAVIDATAPAKAKEAAGIAAATAPIEENKAVNIASRTAPIEVAKAVATEAGTQPIKTAAKLMEPIANRVTGGVDIPWNDREVRHNYYVSQGKPDPEGAFTPSPEPATATSAAKAPVPAGTVPPKDEVPAVPLPTGLMPKAPGTVLQGRDPVAIEAAKGAVEQANEKYKEISAAATTANSMRASLGTMRTIVQNGGVTPSATAPVRAMLSSYLNATLGPEVAKRVTGIDPAQAEVVNKESTRMGLNFARQTEGAREAVQGIKIALGANPNLGNTDGGYKTLIDLMDAGAKHDQDAQTYANAMFEKNGHYVGAKEWFDQAHPPAEYTSKVVPYNLPRLQDGSVDPSQLQPNVTYQGKSGLGIWNGQGFVPVKK